MGIFFFIVKFEGEFWNLNKAWHKNRAHPLPFGVRIEQTVTPARQNL
jgi:hypothetical protein